MSDFITLTCPSCGNKLQITEDIDRFVCAACGNEHIVNRSGGIISLKPVIDSIKSVQVGVDKTASELAIVRLNKEISSLEGEVNSIMRRLPDSCLAFFFTEEIGCGLTVILCLIGIIVFFAADKFLGGVIFLAGLGILIIGNQMGKEQNMKNENEARSIKARLEGKKRELAFHQDNVTKFK